MRTRPNLAFEYAAQARGAQRIVGVDEVGRGPWAGPVVACAVYLHGPPPEGLDDSKRLARPRRAALVPLIKAIAEHALGIATVEEVDTLGIRCATALAMQRAVAALTVAPDHLLIDGVEATDWTPCPAERIVRGDSRSSSIAAASVLAKQHRDAAMVALAQQHPGYGWETNVGYGTPAHRAGLAARGITSHHRRSFAPIRALLQVSD